MRYSTLVTALAASASAAPLEARDGPHGAHGSMNMGAATPPPAGGAASNPLAGLFSGGGGFDLSKLMQGGGLADIAKFMTPEMMKTYGSLAGNFLPKQKAFKIEELKPILRADAKRVKIIYGPYVLKGTETKKKLGNGFSFDPSGTGYMYMADSDFPRDITIIGVESGVTDDKFEPIDIGKGLYNHHNVFYDLGSSPVAVTGCSKGGMGYNIPVNIFMGGAAESSASNYTTNDGKFNSGFYLAKNAPIGNMIDVVNYNKDDKTIYVVSQMEYVPGKIADAQPASAQIIDIGQCSGSTGLFVHPPAGKKQWTLNSSEIAITQDGTFLGAKAHMHDGALNMVTYLNGKEICDSVALYGGPGREGTNVDGSHWSGIAGTTMCEKPFTVKKGDTLRFVANFDIEKHPEREQHSEGEGHGEMGMGMAEGMALFTASFALNAPGTDAKYTIA